MHPFFNQAIYCMYLLHNHNIHHINTIVFEVRYKIQVYSLNISVYTVSDFGDFSSALKRKLFYLE